MIIFKGEFAMKQDRIEAETAAEGRGMTDRRIDAEFAKTTDALAAFPRRRGMIPPSGPGEDALELGYNGRMYVLRRGEWLELPEPLCEVLEHAGAL